MKIRYSQLAFTIVVSLATVGCRTPEAGYQKSWSERWADQLAFWKNSDLQQQHQQAQSPLTVPPGPKPDEKMAAAMMLEHEGKVERAIVVYEEILQKDKNRTEVHHRVAQLYDIKGNPDSALKHYQIALRQKPKDSDLLCDFGYHYYLIGQPAQAEKILRQSIEQQGTLSRAHNNLALVLAQQGRHEEALEAFRTAGSDRATAHANLAFALMWDEHWTDAAKHVDMAMAIDPSSKAALRAKASVHSVIAAVHRTGGSSSQVMQTHYAVGAGNVAPTANATSTSPLPVHQAAATAPLESKPQRLIAP